MAEDREILREVWDSSIPILFSLSPEEIVSLQRPDPYYLMVPRVSYFALVMDKVIKYFSKFVTSNNSSASDLWLDFNGRPLKWHYPVGLLWDMFGHENDRIARERDPSLPSNTLLPWTITIHFQDFPEEDLIRCSTRSAIESSFISTIKEADTLKHRGDIMSSLQKKDHNMLWTGLVNNRFDQFWSVNQRLMSTDSGETSKSPSKEAPSSTSPIKGYFRSIPIRVYLPDKNPQNYIQKLVKPVNESGSVTLLDFMRQLNLFPSVTSSTSSHDTSCLEGDTNDSKIQFPSNIRVLTHGMEVPLESPLQWMSQHLSYPDNFIHLCILPSQTRRQQQET